MVVFVDEVDEYSTTLFRIGDNRGHRRQIGDDPVLEVEDKTRLGGQVGQPVPRARSGNPAQVDGILKPVEADFDPPRLPGVVMSMVRSSMVEDRPMASAWRTSSRIRACSDPDPDPDPDETLWHQ
jgi:hypothetical protein